MQYEVPNDFSVLLYEPSSGGAIINMSLLYDCLACRDLLNQGSIKLRALLLLKLTKGHKMR